jgi:hypothetical protein
MTIPSPILEGSGIAEAKCAELHQLRHCVAVLQGKMTTYELIEAIESISGLAESLTTHLADVCGICGGCDACNETLEGEQEIKIPPELLDELAYSPQRQAGGLRRPGRGADPRRSRQL